jgi:hypothetical protein
LVSAGAHAQVVINEIMSSNAQVLRDEDGDTPDWIELFNPGSEEVNLQDWALSDDSLETDKWKFAATRIQPGGYLLVFASDKDRRSGPNLHTNFKLGAGRDPVFLYNASGIRVDQFIPGCIPTDISFGRIPDGSSLLFHLSAPSPGSSNNGSNYFTVRTGKDTVIFSHTGGFFPDSFQLILSVTSAESTLHYTTDGSVPDETSPVYTGPIAITSRKGQENIFSDIETSPLWLPPAGEVFKVTVVRAAAYIDGCPVSPVFTHTFFVDPNMVGRYSYPLVSLATDESAFFGKKKGIYIVGGSNDGSENYFRSGKEWERPIHLEYFNTDGTLEFAQNLGARIHGRGSRGNPQKSLRVYARDEYGKDRIDFKPFDGLDLTSFKVLILRNPDADFSNTMFKDELVHTLLKGRMDLDFQAFRPLIVFLNGEYWGIHNLRERQDKDYLAIHYGLDPTKVDILGYSEGKFEIIEGDARHYMALLAYIRSHDLSIPEYYESVAERIEIDNFIDYHIAQLYLANFDWPNNNVRLWRPKTETGKWRWFFFDCDACMIKYSSVQLYEYTSAEDDPDNLSTILLRNLLKNSDFRSKFISRFLYHINTTFEPSRVMTFVDQFQDLYAPMTAEHIARWRTPPTSNHWMEAIKHMRVFTLQRPVEMLDQLTNAYKMPFVLYPNPATDVVQIKTGISGELPVIIRFFNARGQLVLERHKQPNESELLPVSVSQLPVGLYLVQIQYGNLIFHEKVVVSR